MVASGNVKGDKEIALAGGVPTKVRVIAFVTGALLVPTALRVTTMLVPVMPPILTLAALRSTALGEGIVGGASNVAEEQFEVLHVSEIGSPPFKV